MRQRPAQPLVMRQSWEQLLFLHWEVTREQIAPTLPDGLEPDNFEGRCFLGIVPFFMRRVRPIGLPSVPWISNFLECNVRTYVIGPCGPGVWFYSLDCDQPVAVETARMFFRLPYFHSRMATSRDAQDRTVYRTQRSDRRSPSARHSRRSAPAVSEFIYRGLGTPAVTQAGSLDFFLIERYLLYTASPKGRIFCGRVWHPPYAIESVEVETHDSLLIESVGFDRPREPAPFRHYSQGVDVEIFPLRQCL